MRYCIIPKGLTLAQIEAELKQSGAKNIKVANRSEMIFAELDDAGLNRIKGIPGLAIKDITKTKPHITPPIIPARATNAVYCCSIATLWSRFAEFRNMFSPPLTGSGLVCAVLGSGIRKTHRSLAGKVVYEKNFSSSPTLDDVFDHDTGTSYLIAGGEITEGEEAGMSPGAKLWNIKVLNDDGEGTIEDLILGMNEVHDKFCEAVDKELPLGDEMYPNAVNISLGTEDDGDLDNPLRLAVEKLYQASPGKFPIFCSAGNDGSYVMLPAAAEHAWAIGAATFMPFSLWEYSSRGCKIPDTIKPEMVFYGVNIVMASSASDNAFVCKSGTSFSCPLALGQLVLMREAGARLGFLEELIALDYEQLETVVAAMSYKPPGVPLGKTPDMGFGMPMGHLMARQCGLGAPTGVAALEQIVPAMVMMIGISMIAKSL